MLLVVGPALQDELGQATFTALYFAGGIAAELAAYSYYAARPGDSPSLQARAVSAAVYALLACNAAVHPYRKFVWLFGIELNSLGCVHELSS